jgi:ABC-type polysaccharide/polyol phosphate export permease
MNIKNYIQYSIVGFSDISAAFCKSYQITTLGWQDVAIRYRRSRIGAFWLTINMAVMIGALGVVFGTLFHQPMEDFLPYLAIGLIVWGFLTACINDGCNGFIASEGIILQIKMPLFTHLARIIWRNIIIFLHNFLILPFVFLYYFKPVSISILAAIPGFILLIFNLAWMMLILAICCARFRDLMQIIQNALQIFFYITPIIWKPSLLPEHLATGVLDWNPFYHFIQVIRSPLVGDLPTSLNWIVLIVMAMIGWPIALIFFGYYRKRVAYWL